MNDTYYRFQGSAQNLVQPDYENEGSDFRGFTLRLLEPRRARSVPKFVVTIYRQVGVETYRDK